MHIQSNTFHPHYTVLASRPAPRAPAEPYPASGLSRQQLREIVAAMVG